MSKSAEDLFTEAWELDPEQREAYLAEACGGDTGLMREVEALLLDAERAELYFSTADGMFRPYEHTRVPGEKAGDWVGPYQLVEKIGAGGFGVVWLALQAKPIKRRVAVKVIKAGMDTREVLARFDAERQALARMEHPNISRVLDAGATAAGRPFFAMELVEGVPVTRYCNEQRLDASERLALFLEICSAVNHAHQKGIIHRDIKPSNILVASSGDKPVVKVIDFGIAKATSGKLTDGTLYTRVEQIIGTPLYMSPEQAGMGQLDIDTRSDIYSLGVVLYELLAGVPPFDDKVLRDAGYDAMRKIIREVEPPRPSTRLAELPEEQLEKIAAARRVPPGRLGRWIRSDLDWIVMKAIDKCRNNRYETADAFARDIRRFLDDEPVTAKPQGTLYVLQKLARRHRSALLVAAGFVLVLAAGTIASTVLAIRARAAEQTALARLAEAQAANEAKERARREAQEITMFLSDVFQRPSPEMDGRDVSVVQVLEAAEQRLKEDSGGSGESRVRLLRVLATTYENLGLPARALELERKALEILKTLPASESTHNLTKKCMLEVVRKAENYGSYEEARDIGNEILERFPEEMDGYGSVAGYFMVTHAQNTFRSGEHAKAIEMLAASWGRLNRRIESMSRRQEGNAPATAIPEIAHINRYSLGGSTDVTLRRGFEGDIESVRMNADSVKALLRKYCAVTRNEALAISILGNEPPRDRQIDKYLRNSRIQHSTLPELLEGAKAEVEKLQSSGKKSPELIHSMTKLASVYYEQQQYDKAVEVMEKAVAMSREFYGEQHPKTADLESQLAHYCEITMKFDAMHSLRAKRLDAYSKYFHESHATHLSQRAERIFTHFLEGKFDEGLSMAENDMPKLKKVFGPASRELINFHANRARCLVGAGRTREGYDIYRETSGYMLYDTFNHLLQAGLECWFQQMEDYEKTRNCLLGFARIFQSSPPNESQILDRNVLITCLAPLKNPEQGREIFATLEVADAAWASPLCLSRELMGPSYRWGIRGIAEYRVGSYEKAIQSLKESVRYIDVKTIDYSKIHRNLPICYTAMALFKLGRTEEAKAMLAGLDPVEMRPACIDHPLKGSTDAMGAILMHYLAYREARKLIDGVEEPVPTLPPRPAEWKSIFE